jgi:hypothetical protein
MAGADGSDEKLIFDARKMNAESNEFVCWLDIMWPRNIQGRSSSVAANFVMKLHIACLGSNSDERVRLYPMNDGVYVRTEDLMTMLS